MKEVIKQLVSIFTKMVENAKTGEFWKNIDLGRAAFGMMCELPDCLPDEFSTPAEKGEILRNMLDQMDELLTPRLCISIRNEIARLNPENEDNILKSGMLQDYINRDLSMEDFCKKYSRHLLFDPVERTEKYEEVILDVETECDKRLSGQPRGMGFCFAYWHERQAAFASHGIEWRSPMEMNPGVLFD